jgi:hypothetical protein
MNDYADKFHERLDQSERARWVAAMLLWRKGNAITLLPTQHERADAGDVLVSKGGTRGVVEVKHLTYDWTGPDDWPFRSKTGAKHVIVDRVDVYSKRRSVPLAYYIFNRALTHVAVVKAATKTAWYTDTIHFKGYARDLEVYLCPLIEVDFRCVEEELAR